jgi:uncharacterized membrane protein
VERAALEELTPVRSRALRYTADFIPGREQDLAVIDAERVGITEGAKVGRDLSGKSDQAMIAMPHEQEWQEAAALAARQPVDAVERYADVADRNLVAAAETAPRLRVDLRSVGKDLVAVARQALAVDRALVRLADERVREARDESACRRTLQVFADSYYGCALILIQRKAHPGTDNSTLTPNAGLVSCILQVHPPQLGNPWHRAR